MNKTLLYIDGNQHLKTGVIATTARKGAKWAEQARPGDVLDCRITKTNELFAQVAVVRIQVTDYAGVLNDASDNHATTTNDTRAARLNLEGALTSAYGPLSPGEVFTKIHFIPLNVNINRADAYAAVDSERDYQDARWGDTLSIGEQILLAEEYISIARGEWAQEKPPEARALNVMRKIAGIAVHCLEDHGSPQRPQREIEIAENESRVRRYGRDKRAGYSAC